MLLFVSIFPPTGGKMQMVDIFKPGFYTLAKPAVSNNHKFVRIHAKVSSLSLTSPLITLLVQKMGRDSSPLTIANRILILTQPIKVSDRKMECVVPLVNLELISQSNFTILKGN